MKIFMLGIVFFSGIANAEPLKVSVSNFSFSYKDPRGEGFAASFNRNNLVANQVNVSVDRIDKDFNFQVSGSENLEFQLKNAPSFMTEAEKMSVQGFNMLLAEKLNLTLAEGRFLSGQDNLSLDGMNLDCGRDLTKKEVMDQLLNGCIQKMSLKTSKFSSQSLEAGLLSELTQSIALALSEKSNLGINSLDLKTNGGRYDLSADIKSQISGKIRSNGQMSYDDLNGKLTVKISQVKFGILNITGKVFDELKKKENEKLIVKQPYLYYSLK
jgi:hypothetical protein